MSLSPTAKQALQAVITDVPIAVDVIEKLIGYFGLSEQTVVRVAQNDPTLPPLQPPGPDVDLDYQTAKGVAKP